MSDKTIIPPEGGWKESSYYLVQVAFNKYNLTHRSIFYSGNIIEGEPGAYNCIFNPTYENRFDIDDIYYLRVEREILDDVDMEWVKIPENMGD